jgi:LysR family transcriptional regulator, nitrogen assimilation regulatory protein
VEVGNITRAAEQLYVAQPALGLQIRALEQDLRVALLVRHSRGVTPTQAGRVLYERAREILRAVEDAKKEVASFGGPENENIALGLTPGVMKLIGRDLMLETRDQLPNVHLSMVEEMSYVLIEALERDEIDIAIAYEAPERPGLFRIPIIGEELLLVTSPDEELGSGQTVTLTQVLQRPLAMATGRDAVRQLVTSAAERLAITPNIAFEASSIGMMKNLVSSGMAVSVMPYGSAVDELRRGELKSVRIEDPALKRTLYVVRSSRRPAFKNEAKLLEAIRGAMNRVVDELGPLGIRLPALGAPFAS